MVIILLIDKGMLALTVAAIEICALLLNLSAYLTLKTINTLIILGFPPDCCSPIDFFYVKYGSILDAIIIAEVIVLCIGAPFSGIFNGISRLWNDINPSATSNYSAVQVDKRIQGETRCL